MGSFYWFFALRQKHQRTDFNEVPTSYLHQVSGTTDLGFGTPVQRFQLLRTIKLLQSMDQCVVILRTTLSPLHFAIFINDKSRNPFNP